MFCQKCGLENSDDAKFCKKCGAELSPVTADVSEEKPGHSASGKEGNSKNHKKKNQKKGLEKSTVIIISIVIVAAAAVLLACLLLFKPFSSKKDTETAPAEQASADTVPDTEKDEEQEPAKKADPVENADILCYTSALKYIEVMNEKLDLDALLQSYSFEDSTREAIKSLDYSGKPKAIYKLDFSNVAASLAKNLETSGKTDSEEYYYAANKAASLNKILTENLPSTLVAQYDAADTDAKGINVSAMACALSSTGGSIACADETGNAEPYALIFQYENQLPVYVSVVPGSDNTYDISACLLTGEAGDLVNNDISAIQKSEGYEGIQIAEYTNRETAAETSAENLAKVSKTYTTKELAAEICEKISADNLFAASYSNTSGEKVSFNASDIADISILDCSPVDEQVRTELAGTSCSEEVITGTVRGSASSAISSLIGYTSIPVEQFSVSTSSGSNVGTLEGDQMGNVPLILVIRFNSTTLPCVAASIMPDKTNGTISYYAMPCFETTGSITADDIYKLLSDIVTGTSSETPTPTPTEAPAQETAVRVDFNHSYSSAENAVITGYDEAGNALWVYNTGSYEVAQLQRIGEIGLNNGLYYFYEDGKVIALNATDGSVAWTNSDFGGAAASSAFGPDGTLYICGYFGPVLTIISPSGATVDKVQDVNGYMWFCNLSTDGNTVNIGVTRESDMSESTIHFNLSDMSLTE